MELVETDIKKIFLISLINNELSEKNKEKLQIFYQSKKKLL